MANPVRAGAAFEEMRAGAGTTDFFSAAAPIAVAFDEDVMLVDDTAHGAHTSAVAFGSESTQNGGSGDTAAGEDDAFLFSLYSEPAFPGAPTDAGLEQRQGDSEFENLGGF